MNIRKGIARFRRQSRFCTPGHKGRLNRSDVTEVEGEFPEGLIARSQERAAAILKTKAVRYLVNGSSIGIKAGLMACEGDILAAANCHQSIREAAALSLKKLFLIENGRGESGDGLLLPPTAEQIGRALDENPSIGTVVLAHPDYYGLNASVDAARLVKERGKTLYVDAAHGAHYPFREDLFDCTVFALADAFNLSAHKTLYAPTQTAYLCVNDASLLDKIDRNLTLLGTTSPFYPFYSGLEYALGYNQRHSRRYDKLRSGAAKLKQAVKCADNDDFTRVVADARHYGLSGKTLFERLRARRILAEKFDSDYVVFILTLADNTRKIRRLRRALEDCCAKR